MTKNISSNSNILGGEPVVVGTRIPISRIFYLMGSGCSISEIKEEFPQLSRKKIGAVIVDIAKLLEEGSIQNYKW